MPRKILSKKILYCIHYGSENKAEGDLGQVVTYWHTSAARAFDYVPFNSVNAQTRGVYIAAYSGKIDPCANPDRIHFANAADVRTAYLNIISIGKSQSKSGALNKAYRLVCRLAANR